MTVALERELSGMSATLESEGYRVVPLYGYRGSVDAVVYKSEGIDSLSLSRENYGESGVLMICAKNMTGEQVAKILRQRNYGEGSILEF